MSRALPRFHATTHRREDEAKISRITREAADRIIHIGHATAGGDQRRLRGIPCIARGVTGAINGSTP